MSPTAVSLAVDTQTVAQAVAAHVPSAVPLVAVPAGDERPDPDALAVVGTFHGRPGATFAVVAEGVVAEMAAVTSVGVAGDTPLAVADALRPALDAAAVALGARAVDQTRTEAAGRALEPDMTVYALQAAGLTVAWFGVRIKDSHVPAPAGGVVPSQRTSMRVLYDVEMTLTVELGRVRLPLRDVLDLAPGAVLELDRAAASPADILVNGRLIARGEVVVVDEDYGVRITQIVSGQEA